MACTIAAPATAPEAPQLWPATLVAFDVEMDRLFASDEIPGTVDIGVRVVSIAILNSIPGQQRIQVQSWHPPLPSNLAATAATATTATTLAPATVCSIIATLWAYFQHGARLVTWGGTATDWPVLARCAQHPTAAMQCAAMAQVAVDLPFTLLCQRGYMVGLEAASRGAGLRNGKPISSKASASAWTADGAESVVALCVSDAINTVTLLHMAQTLQVLKWLA